MATNEYIGAKRRMYTTADRKKRIRILDEVCETTGYERKYANRLLTGSRKFRERKGRGKTYGEEVAVALKKVWIESGCRRCSIPRERRELSHNRHQKASKNSQKAKTQ
jgi:hypothetical protein